LAAKPKEAFLEEERLLRDMEGRSKEEEAVVAMAEREVRRIRE
jgi:hypothetical protein